MKFRLEKKQTAPDRYSRVPKVEKNYSFCLLGSTKKISSIII